LGLVEVLEPKRLPEISMFDVENVLIMTRHQKCSDMYWQSSTKLICRDLCRKLRFSVTMYCKCFTPSLEWPLCLPFYDHFRFDVLIDVKVFPLKKWGSPDMQLQNKQT